MQMRIHHIHASTGTRCLRDTTQQLLVESSDLELEQVDLPAAPSEDPNAEGASSTMLGLRLTFYDKQPVTPDVEAVGADPKPESASLKEAPN